MFGRLVPMKGRCLPSDLLFRTFYTRKGLCIVRKGLLQFRCLVIVVVLPGLWTWLGMTALMSAA